MNRIGTRRGKTAGGYISEDAKAVLCMEVVLKHGETVSWKSTTG